MIRTQEALEARLRSGSMIRETRVHEPEEKSIWNVVETGESVHGQAVRLVRTRGLLKPLADGLFGEAQTYALNDEAA